MAMFHGAPYPCCEKRSGRCDAIPPRDYWTQRAFMFALGIVLTFHYKSAGRFIDWWFGQAPAK